MDLRCLPRLIKVLTFIRLIILVMVLVEMSIYAEIMAALILNTILQVNRCQTAQDNFMLVTVSMATARISTHKSTVVKLITKQMEQEEILIFMI